ncbi:MAG: DNA polymerase III subunit delta [Deltaproteobacteria bacterium]|nr:DNA polymerase III subunit delta [Deltaproteobacteria bacterium]
MKSADDPIELAKAVTSASTCVPLFLFCAPDEIRRRRFCERLVEKFISKAGLDPAACAVFLDAKSFDQRQLVALRDDLSSLSLFSNFRIFFIRNIDQLPSACTESFLKLVSSELPGVSCICLGAGLPATSVILKHFKAKKAAALLPDLEGDELTRWVQKELKEQGIAEYESEVPTQLIQIAEGSPDRITQSVAHLSLYSGGEKLTAKEVRSLFSDSLDASEYDFVDALMQRNHARSESLIQVILGSGKNPFMLLSLLQRSFSTYISVAALLKEGKSPPDIAQALRLPPWLLKKHLAVVQKYSVEQLKRCVEALLRADSKLKNRSLGTESIFSEFVYSVTHEV